MAKSRMALIAAGITATAGGLYYRMRSRKIANRARERLSVFSSFRRTSRSFGTRARFR